MRLPGYANRKFEELGDSLYSLKNNICYGIAGLTLLAMTACGNAAPAQPVQTPATPIVQPPAQEQLYTLQGTVFHDFNGNGTKEENEPAIPGVELDLYSKVWLPESVRDAYPVNIISTPGSSRIRYEIQLNTDSDGNYSIQMPEGDYEFTVDKNN